MIKKINPFVQIYEAIKGFSFSDSFYNLRRQSTGSKILYAMIISVLTSLLLCYLFAFNIASDKELNQTLNDLPDFSYANGELYCAEQCNITEDETCILIDTTQNEYTEANLRSMLNDSNFTQLLMMSKTNIVIYRGTTGEYQNMSWNDFMGVFGIQSFSKQQLLSGYRKVIYSICTIVFLFTIPFQFIKLFFMSLILTLIALICNSASHADKDFPTLYWISFYIESIFLIIIAIFQPLGILGGSARTIACLIFFIITMTNTLKHGDPTLAASGPVSNGSNDDFDRFMDNSGSGTMKSAFGEPTSSTYADSADTYAEPARPDPFAGTQETAPQDEQTKSDSSSGLSLKLKD
ncbi:MAG: DUF1189 domain-containing protein [Clostridium sp.]|nr:DUF1189 domain-containing protein [Clostridium sp.]